VSAPQRAALERRFHLVNGRLAEATTWSYELTDTSFGNIRALVRAPLVDDTAHIHRRFFRPAFTYDRIAKIAAGAFATGLVVVAMLFLQSRVASAAGTTHLSERALVALAGIPPVSVLACAVSVLLLAALGFEPVWANIDVTLVEAARDGDIAEVYRLVQAGENPNRSGAVRLDSGRVVTLTPLEAAVESRQVEVLEVLMNAGARASEGERQILICLAAAVSAAEVAEYVHSTLTPAAPPDCAGREIPPH
jgi:hypothetical protein